MLLVVGLGNPGSDYADNRHNIGFMAVDAVQRAHGFSPFRGKFHGELADGNVAGEKVLLLKPTTYMNESGRAVQAAMAFYKIVPEDVVVFHDELDLAGGKLRIKRGGGHAGHNGLRSIHDHVGSAYARLRLGIGHPGDKDRVIGHVLKDFSKTERAWVEKLTDAIAEHFPRLVKGDDGGFMSKVAADLAPPKPKPEPKPISSEDD
jgi:peptidyl-tRNA hydrolase, PTH1 family